jgi:hypothetical protein
VARAEAAEAIARWTEDPFAQLKRRASNDRGLPGMAAAMRRGDWKGGGSDG